MSDDVRNLLDQIGQPKFDYHEFMTDGERPGYWPIFRTVIDHPALRPLAAARFSSAPASLAASRALPRTEHDTPRTETSGRGEPLFRRYAAQERVPGASGRNEGVRDVLRRLSSPGR